MESCLKYSERNFHLLIQTESHFKLRGEYQKFCKKKELQWLCLWVQVQVSTYNAEIIYLGNNRFYFVIPSFKSYSRLGPLCCHSATFNMLMQNFQVEGNKFLEWISHLPAQPCYRKKLNYGAEQEQVALFEENLELFHFGNFSLLCICWWSLPPPCLGHRGNFFIIYVSVR